MAMDTGAIRRPRRAGRAERELSPRTKMALMVGTAGVVLLIGGFYAIEFLTAPPKPDLNTAPPAKVAEYLGHARGFASLSIPEREKFVINVLQNYKDEEKVRQLSQQLRQLSGSEQQQFLDATFDIGKKRLVEASDEYARVAQNRKKEFLGKVVADFDTLRVTLGGQDFNNPNNLTTPFKEHVPTKSDQWTKLILERTTPAERAKAQPLIDDLSEHMSEMKRAKARSG